MIRIGTKVIVNSPGHGQDGRTGIVDYHGRFFGTLGVIIDGKTYGFMPNEIEVVR